ncbi:hypothetical protein MHBO_003719 [Bonamia ostreae]|uniref:HNH nuclease domain-containing protein n=1 Tax=Bonamia ostreae TaxID=126728 RepID=A0ABV2AS25_9EUKA
MSFKTKTLRYSTKTINKVHIKNIEQRFAVEGDLPMCVYCNKILTKTKTKKDQILPLKNFFCSNECLREFKIKTAPNEGRKQIFDIENGVCQKCGINLRALYLRLKPLKPTQREKLLLKVKSFSVLKKERVLEICGKKRFSEGLLWQADHIVPVQFGGGNCPIENFQTLCAGCHYSKTCGQAKKATSFRKFLRDKKKNFIDLT